VLAGLRAPDRMIVMNERRKLQMEQKPGRRRLTQGHEMGHWDLFVDKSKLDHPTPFEAAAPSLFAYRSSTGGEVQIIKALLASDEGRELLPHITGVLEAVDRLRRAADEQLQISRAVRIGTVHAATVPLLFPVVQQFRAAHPGPPGVHRN